MTITSKTRLNTSYLLLIMLFLWSCGGDDGGVPAPESPVILNTTISGFTFSWNDSGQPIRLQVSENEGFSPTAFDSTYESSPSVVPGLKSGTTYFVRAQQAAVASPFTEAVQITTNDLIAPSNFTVSQIFGDSFKISWTALEGATYALDVSLEQSFATLLDGYDALAIETNQVTVAVPQIETTYYFRVKSVNGMQSSAYSEVGMATTDNRLIFSFSSSAFSEGGKIPAKYSCQAPSPPLSWKNPPEGTVTLALIMVDLDFQQGYNHWVVFDILPSNTGFPEGASGPNIPGGSTEGRNDLGQSGYFGPCPPGGESHRYVFTLYALDKRLNLGGGANDTLFLSAIEGHVIGQKTLTGLYN